MKHLITLVALVATGCGGGKTDKDPMAATNGLLSTLVQQAAETNSKLDANGKKLDSVVGQGETLRKDLITGDDSMQKQLTKAIRGESIDDGGASGRRRSQQKSALDLAKIDVNNLQEAKKKVDELRSYVNGSRENDPRYLKKQIEKRDGTIADYEAAMKKLRDELDAKIALLNAEIIRLKGVISQFEGTKKRFGQSSSRDRASIRALKEQVKKLQEELDELKKKRNTGGWSISSRPLRTSGIEANNEMTRRDFEKARTRKRFGL